MLSGEVVGGGGGGSGGKGEVESWVVPEEAEGVSDWVEEGVVEDMKETGEAGTVGEEEEAAEVADRGESLRDRKLAPDVRGDIFLRSVGLHSIVRTRLALFITGELRAMAGMAVTMPLLSAVVLDTTVEGYGGGGGTAGAMWTSSDGLELRAGGARGAESCCFDTAVEG